MKSFVAITAVLALAQVSVAQSIPSGISSGCSSFLSTLNTNPSLSATLKGMNSALSAFSGDKAASATSNDAETAIAKLCSASFDASSIKQYVTQYADACSDELTGDNANDVVKKIYDRLYTLTPMRNAYCSKDTTGNYCAMDIDPEDGAQVPMGNAANPFTAVGSMFEGTNLAWLLVSGKGSKADVCTDCTRNVLLSYTGFEAANPHALSVAHSPILGQQSTIWQNVNELCGADFMTQTGTGSNAVNAGGSLGISGAATHTVSVVGVGALAFAASVLLL